VSLVRRLSAHIAFRGGILRRYRVTLLRRPVPWLRFVFFDRETTNFTYDIENEDELMHFVADALGRPIEEVARYVGEVRDDAELRSTLTRRLHGSPMHNDTPRFGRRVGWYCLVRALKPRLIIETGTADGLGTALLARALERNAAEGEPGRLLSLDIDEHAGWLLDEDLRRHAELIIGDSAETLPASLRGEEVDLFIHDSAHTVEHERLELELALQHASPRLVLVSDNAHATSVLRDLARDHGLEYRFFRERPRRHFYPGAGIGLALTPVRVRPSRPSRLPSR
jgi:predicted O-methyltransferase YrrM